MYFVMHKKYILNLSTMKDLKIHLHTIFTQFIQYLYTQSGIKQDRWQIPHSGNERWNAGRNEKCIQNEATGSTRTRKQALTSLPSGPGGPLSPTSPTTPCGTNTCKFSSATVSKYDVCDKLFRLLQILDTSSRNLLPDFYIHIYIYFILF